MATPVEEVLPVGNGRPAATGYARFDSRARLSLGRYVQVSEGDYARVTRRADGTLVIEPVPFPGKLEVGA